jgi:hypothetical protein
MDPTEFRRGNLMENHLHFFVIDRRGVWHDYLVDDRHLHLLPDLEKRLAVVVPDSTPLDELAERFAAAGIPAAEWTHVAHLHVGAWHAHHLTPEAALKRMRSGIRRLNLVHGTANSATRGYHETITAAYLRLIADFLATCPVLMPLEARVEGLLASPVAQPEVLARFYSRKLLLSARARKRWVDPDLAPLLG